MVGAVEARTGPQIGSSRGQVVRRSRNTLSTEEPRSVLVVFKKSKLDLYVHEKKNAHYAALLEAGAEVVRSFEAAHKAHAATLKRVVEALEGAGLPYRLRYRAGLRTDMTSGKALVVTVGGDGTLLDACRKVEDAPVLGVNSDPDRSVGFLCAANAETFSDVLAEVMSGRVEPTPVARLGATLDGEPLKHPVLNDALVADGNPAATARYLIEARGHREAQKSSGIWFAGPAGSTAAVHSAGGRVLPLDDGRMQMRVREAFHLEGAPYQLVDEVFDPEEEVVVVSKMREGRIFLDGPHARLPFPAGAELRLSANGRPLNLVVTEGMRRRRSAVVAHNGFGIPG